MRAGVLRYSSNLVALYNGLGLPIWMYISKTSSGILTHLSVDLSNSRAVFVYIFGSNAFREGPVFGSFAGGKDSGRSGTILYHSRGRSSTGRFTTWLFITFPALDFLVILRFQVYTFVLGSTKCIDHSIVEIVIQAEFGVHTH